MLDERLECAIYDLTKKCGVFCKVRAMMDKIRLMVCLRFDGCRRLGICEPSSAGGTSSFRHCRRFGVVPPEPDQSHFKSFRE